MTYKAIKYRAANGYDPKEASDEATLPMDPVSLTVQSQAEDADINVLMARYGLTGRMPENPKVPMYGDFSEITDYRSALAAIERAQAGFQELPANVRARFENNPQLLLEFCSNDGNRAEAEKLGLLKALQPTPVSPGVPGGPLNDPSPAKGGATPVASS